jgi:hypothetical protein
VHELITGSKASLKVLVVTSREHKRGASSWVDAFRSYLAGAFRK